MRLDLFSEGDSVLLLGEGNFSFSVCLHKHNLPIKIVATCFESEPEFEQQLENIEYLKSNKVPVFLNVDATKLRENPIFSGAKFSKIVFNFPHVGGKMKIHLNRELLRSMFESCSQILTEDGLVIVSLCRGQGGTPADRPRRTWHDSWQVTEMAAHGDFLLTAVEPFLRENFTDYHCVGYRGRDVHFHLSGALVHVFAKGAPPYDLPHDSLPPTRLALVPLRRDSDVFVPIIYSELYRNNPSTNPHSPLSFLKQSLLENLSRDTATRLFNDDDIPFHVETGGGVPCKVNGVRRTLRSTPLDIFPYLKPLDGEKVLFSGTYFCPLGRDFSTGPVQVRFVVIGESLSHVRGFLEGLIDLFEDEDVVLSERHLGNGEIPESASKELVLENRRTSSRVQAAILYEFQCGGSEICVVNAQAICQYFFAVGWRELWAEGTKVVVGPQRPTLRSSSLYPSEYRFDMTVRYTKPYPEDRLWELLWLAAGHLIEEVETVSEYTSGEGWSSKCYRLSYRSWDRPLFRRRVIDIHSKIVGRVVELGLDVAIG